MNAVPALDLALIAPGFADAVADSQSVFRRVMDAVARPGTIENLAFAPEPPVGLDRAAGAVALTLFDFETPVWLDRNLDDGPAASWIRFHASCPLVDTPSEAAFAILTDVAAAPPLSAFNQGDAKYPDRSTTLVIQVPALIGGCAVVLEGPGVKGRATLAPAPG